MAKLVKEELLILTNIGGNNNKFYRLKMYDNGGEFEVLALYGRVNTSGQRSSKTFSDESSAEKHFQKTIASKVKKGYEPVETEDLKKDDGVKAKKDQVTVLENKVLEFIDKIYAASKTFVKQSVRTPLGKLSENQVNKGYEVVKQIEELLDKGVPKTDSQYELLSNQFYKAIPYVFGAKIDPREAIIADYNRLNNRRELLDVMLSLVKVQSDLDSGLEAQYKALNIKLRHVEKVEDEYKRLDKKVTGTIARNHHFGIKVKNIYEVEDMANVDKFNPNKIEVMELFHGSRSENIIHILQSGLRIKPSTAVHTGSMFGNGIYFADRSSKSANYCWGFGNRRGDEYYLLICEVATGKIKEYENAQSFLSKAPKGYDSVKGVEGRSLYNNEYIVYNENQSRIKYIVQFTTN